MELKERPKLYEQHEFTGTWASIVVASVSLASSVAVFFGPPKKRFWRNLLPKCLILKNELRFYLLPESLLITVP